MMNECDFVDTFGAHEAHKRSSSQVIYEYYSSSTAKKEEEPQKDVDNQFENFKSLIEEVNFSLKRKERPSTDLLFLLKGATEKLKQN